MRRQTNFIVVHCAATPPGSDIGVDEIGQWHRLRGFDSIGYHAVIRRNGEIEFGRHFDEPGAHVKGQNFQSVGVCMVGGVDDNGQADDNFTDWQFESLRSILDVLTRAYPNAEIVGHRDLSPDYNGDGIIDSADWLKECPSFDIKMTLEKWR